MWLWLMTMVTLFNNGHTGPMLVSSSIDGWGSRIRIWSLVEIWMLKFGQDSEARSRILSWILVEILNLKWGRSWWRLWGWSLVEIPKLIMISLCYDLLSWKRSNFGSIVPLAMFHLNLNKSYIHPSAFGPNIQTPQRLNSSKVNFETSMTFFVRWGMNYLLISKFCVSQWEEIKRK